MTRGLARLTGGVLLAGASLGVQRPAPPVDRPVPFRVGEILTYDISWTSVVTAGVATMSLKDRRNMGGGHAAYDIVFDARPAPLLEKIYPVSYKADSLLDTSTLQPISATVSSDERGVARTRLTRFLPGGQNNIEYEVRTPSVTEEQHRVPPKTIDALSSLYVVRTLPLAPGMDVTLPVTDSGRVYQAHVTVDGFESLRTPLGTMPAWRISSTIVEAGNPQGPPQHITAWISTDARRLPLRLELALKVGTFGLTLTSVTGG